MRSLFWLLVLSGPAWADDAASLCATNPAYSQAVMLSVVQSQLQHDHDAALDGDTPEHLAERAVEQGVAECAAALRADPRLAAALGGLGRADAAFGWDAFNTACADRAGSKGACITAEVGSARALRTLAGAGAPAGARTLVQACALVLRADPPMTDWRQCVDEGLAVHASDAAAARCKLALSWHSAGTGAEAGAAVARCLRQ